jgi:hypothetical protein
MNLFQSLVIQALLLLGKQLDHIERKLDHLSVHLGAAFPPELIKTGDDLKVKTEALRAALDAQAPTPKLKKEPS